MKTPDYILPRTCECPSCGNPVTIEDFNPGACPVCGKSYKWVTVGTEGAETTDSGHDYVSWR